MTLMEREGRWAERKDVYDHVISAQSATSVFIGAPRPAFVT